MARRRNSPRLGPICLLATLAWAGCGDSGAPAESDGQTGSAGPGGSSGPAESTAQEPCDSPTEGCPCPAGQHVCAGECVDDMSIDHCGDACSPCPDDPEGDPVCDGSSCGLACRAGALLCAGACAVCPGGVDVEDFTCDGAACVPVCADGTEPCDAGCCEAGLVTSNKARAPSIAVDSLDDPHVSFLTDSYLVTYAHRDAGGWHVMPLGAEGNAYGTAIAVADDDTPIVAYSANYALRVARLAGMQWQHETVYESAQGYGPEMWPGAIALDSAGRLHIASVQVVSESGTYRCFILHIWWDGGEWQREYVQEEYDSKYSGPSLAIDGDDGLHITWVNYYNDALMYATNAGGAWVSGPALMNGSCCGTSFIALDAGGRPHVTYKTDEGAYAVADRTMGAWSFAAIEAAVYQPGNLAFDSTDRFHYLRVGTALHHGSPDGAGWTEATIDASAEEFMLTVDSADRAHIVWTKEEALRYANP